MASWHRVVSCELRSESIRTDVNRARGNGGASPKQVVQMIARTVFARLDCLVVIVVALVAAAVATESPPPADSTAAHADTQQQQPINGPDESKSEGELDLKTLDKELFKRLFAKRRKEHLEAVKKLQKMDSYERQYKMINMLAEKMFDVIESQKVVVENLTESDLRNISFDSQSHTDAVSNVLENIALFGDMVLNLPDVTLRVLRKQPKWNETIRWSFEFLNRTQDLLDKSTLRMIKLALQELNMTKREANYFNPNRIPNNKPAAAAAAAARSPNQPTTKKDQKNKEKKRKKGPTITRVEL